MDSRYLANLGLDEQRGADRVLAPGDSSPRTLARWRRETEGFDAEEMPLLRGLLAVDRAVATHRAIVEQYRWAA